MLKNNNNNKKLVLLDGPNPILTYILFLPSLGNLFLTWENVLKDFLKFEIAKYIL